MHDQTSGFYYFSTILKYTTRFKLIFCSFTGENSSEVAIFIVHFRRNGAKYARVYSYFENFYVETD
jgi:hypothetical protein